MNSPTLKYPPATLLALPVELRQQILRYAFLENCSPTSNVPYYNETDIQVTFHIWNQYSGRPDPKQYGHWGLELMSRIMRVNRQLLFDAIYVVYSGEFVFCFPEFLTEFHVKNWLATIGEKKSLVRRIGVEIVVRLRQMSVRGANMGVELKRQALVALKSELGGLKSVEFRLWFKERARGGEKERKLVIETLVGLMGIFRGVKIVIVRETRWLGYENETRAIVMACKERLKDA